MLGCFTEKITKKCKNCSQSFKVNRPWQEFCGTKCRFAFWTKQHPRVKV